MSCPSTKSSKDATNVYILFSMRVANLQKHEGLHAVNYVKTIPISKASKKHDLIHLNKPPQMSQ